MHSQQKPFFRHFPPAPFPFRDALAPLWGVSMPTVHFRTPFLEKTAMKTLSLRNLAAPLGAADTKAPLPGVARDILRTVTTAVLAGTAFALLLALTVLSLTLIAPPAQASGTLVTVTETPVNGGGPDTAADTAAPLHLAAAEPQPQAQTKQPPQVAVHEKTYESLEKSKFPLVFYIVLALVAAFLGYFGYTMAKGKS